MERGCPYLYTGSKFRVIWPSVLIIQGGLQQPSLGKYVWEKPSGEQGLNVNIWSIDKNLDTLKLCMETVDHKFTAIDYYQLPGYNFL